MAASLLRRGTYNSRDIKFELEAVIVVMQEEREAMEKLCPKLELSPATKRLWKELQQEKIALERLYMQATGLECIRPEPVCDREMGALKAFFEAMHGRRWKDLSGWLGRAATANTTGVSPFSCNPWCWYGVECSEGGVKSISMSGNQLQGMLPGAELANMCGLVTLDLSDNEIGGTLPPELGKLVHLQYVRLAVTKLEGQIPDTLGEIKGLRELDISYSRLSGPIPESLECCAKLSLLNLSHNRLSGSIPHGLGKLRGMRELFLGHNRLTGPVPLSFAELMRLQSLSLSCNSLQGPLSPWLGNLTSLRLLLLDNNQLSGRLPKSVRKLRDLEVAQFQRNSLCGTIPRCLGELHELRVLNLAGNRLRGKVPRELGELTKLVGLEIGNNFVAGPLPAELGCLSRLVDLHILDGCPSYSLPLHRGFTRHAFERVFVTGPALGLNNTTYPRGEAEADKAVGTMLVVPGSDEEVPKTTDGIDLSPKQCDAYRSQCSLCDSDG